MSSMKSGLPRGGVAAATLLLCLGCATDLGPISGPLTGRWIGPSGVDTGESFVLEEHGSTVLGTFNVFIDVTAEPPAKVTGRVILPRVTLFWHSMDGRSISANLLLSADGRTLTGTSSIDNGPSSGFGPFTRAD